MSFNFKLYLGGLLASLMSGLFAGTLVIAMEVAAGMPAIWASWLYWAVLWLVAVVSLPAWLIYLKMSEDGTCVK